MQMVRSRRTAHGAVVENGEIMIHLRKEQHIREMMPDGLGQMLVAHHYEMVPENGIRIHLNIVGAAFLPLVFDMELLLGPVVGAEEALACRNGCFINFRRGRSDAAWIQLHAYFEPADIEMLVRCLLERTEVLRSQRPYGQLILDEFLDVGHIREVQPMYL